MSSLINIVSNEPVKDADGFVVNTGKSIASVRAYKENKHGSEAWKNQAAFSAATSLFRFRKIPNITVNTDMRIVCGGERYNIVSVDDVRNRGMYVEVLAEKVTASEG